MNECFNRTKIFLKSSTLEFGYHLLFPPTLTVSVCCNRERISEQYRRGKTFSFSQREKLGSQLASWDDNDWRRYCFCSSQTFIVLVCHGGATNMKQMISFMRSKKNKRVKITVCLQVKSVIVLLLATVCNVN